MAVTISELDALGSGASLSKNDMFEIQRQADSRSYRVTAEDIYNYVGTQANGAFRGVVTSLDGMTNEHIGVWIYNPGENSSISGFPNAGILEVIGYEKFDSTNSNYIAQSVIQILHAVDGPYYRFVSNNNAVASGGGTWYPLANRNGNAIQYGETSDTSVTFDTPFRAKPAVTITPYVGTGTQYVYIPMLLSVSTTGFQVTFYRSSLVAAQEITVTEESTANNNVANQTSKSETTTNTSSNTQTENSGNTSSEEVGSKVVKTTETTRIRGAWEEASDVTYQWVATVEDSLWGYSTGSGS